MDDETPSRAHAAAKKSLGQNFLIDPNLQRKIVASLEPDADDEVLEIGPGHGALTHHLAGRVRRLVLVELDDALARGLADEFADEPSIQVVNADILETSLDDLLDDPSRAKVIGNIPYNITTPIIFALLERQPRPREIVLMVQREVADRILAEPGSKTFGALTVGVQTLAAVDRVADVGRKAFRPMPDVESTVIRIQPYSPPPLSPTEEDALRNLTRAAFGQRRKQFQKILRQAYGLAADEITRLEASLGVDLRRRPETFQPEFFVRLARELNAAA